MQIKSEFFINKYDYSAHLPVKMQFLAEKCSKHLRKCEIFRNFAAEFIASAMARSLPVAVRRVCRAAVGVRGIELGCGGNQPL